jgi:hypothetical protein
MPALAGGTGGGANLPVPNLCVTGALGGPCAAQTRFPIMVAPIGRRRREANRVTVPRGRWQPSVFGIGNREGKGTNGIDGRRRAPAPPNAAAQPLISRPSAFAAGDGVNARRVRAGGMTGREGGTGRSAGAWRPMCGRARTGRARCGCRRARASREARRPYRQLRPSRRRGPPDRGDAPRPAPRPASRPASRDRPGRVAAGVVPSPPPPPPRPPPAFRGCAPSSGTPGRAVAAPAPAPYTPRHAR